jgi:methionyl-tRNA synthetase
MPAKTPFYITTAISYPNGPPHIGHAYEAIATDAIARFMRLDGYDVYFLTGTDEHGQKIQQTAAREGLTPRQLLDRNVPLFEAMVKRLECSNDDFIHTTEERHHRSSEEIWRRMEQNGDIYPGKYAGWYSVRDEAYYAEDETQLNEQKERVATKTGTPVEWVEEESYFFKLSAYQDKLLKLYERPNYVLPRERLNEVMSFVKGGLQDLSVSRTTFDWGVRVPDNPKHVMYVWVDALTNYITAVGFPDTDSEKFRKYWPADLHVIGKDIVRFHAVYWPAFLMSAGVEVPRRIFSHGFLFNRGEKMSKSVGNVIDPFDLAKAYGVDPLRYFFLREVPFGQDGNYSHEAIVARINADLANDLGNLAQRSLTMVARNFAGVLPKPAALSATDQAILGAADAMIGKAREVMATQQLHQVLNAVWAVVADANRYFAGEAPWALAKIDPQRQGTVLYVTAEVLRQIAILAQPFMPASAAKLLDLLAVPGDERLFSFLGGTHRIAAGGKLPAPAAVFPRYVEPEAPAPTFMDHYYLQFWLWACVTDGEAFLQANIDFTATLRGLATRIPSNERAKAQEQRKLLQKRSELAKYHFVTTMGSLLRQLQRTHSLFPEIQLAYDKAHHLRKEGKDLRDMIEHADEYLAGRGRKPAQFVRTAEDIATNIPGDQPGMADATSLIVDDKGHWLGGRLNVEQVLSEVRAILAEAEKIPPPESKARPARGNRSDPLTL